MVAQVTSCKVKISRYYYYKRLEKIQFGQNPGSLESVGFFSVVEQVSGYIMSTLEKLLKYVKISNRHCQNSLSLVPMLVLWFIPLLRKSSLLALYQNTRSLFPLLVISDVYGFFPVHFILWAL